MNKARVSSKRCRIGWCLGAGLLFLSLGSCATNGRAGRTAYRSLALDRGTSFGFQSQPYHLHALPLITWFPASGEIRAFDVAEARRREARLAAKAGKEKKKAVKPQSRPVDKDVRH